MAATEVITQIDQQIDANRAAMLRRLRFNPDMSARQWQAAWDRCPDLVALDHELFRQRGIAQQERDEAEHKAFVAKERAERRAARAKFMRVAA